MHAAISVNQPTSIVLNHLDHFDPDCRDGPKLSFRAEQFRREVAGQLGALIDYVGCSPADIMRISD